MHAMTRAIATPDAVQNSPQFRVVREPGHRRTSCTIHGAGSFFASQNTGAQLRAKFRGRAARWRHTCGDYFMRRQLGDIHGSQ